VSFSRPSLFTATARLQSDDCRSAMPQSMCSVRGVVHRPCSHHHRRVIASLGKWTTQCSVSSAAADDDNSTTNSLNFCRAHPLQGRARYNSIRNLISLPTLTMSTLSLYRHRMGSHHREPG